MVCPHILDFRVTQAAESVLYSQISTPLPPTSVQLMTTVRDASARSVVEFCSTASSTSARICRKKILTAHMHTLRSPTCSSFWGPR